MKSQQSKTQAKAEVINVFQWLALLVLLCALPMDTSAQWSWREFGELSVERSYFEVQKLPDGKLIVMGGFKNGNAVSKSCDIIDPESQVIYPGPEMNDKRSCFASVVLSDGSIVVLGGYTAGYSSTTLRIERLDPTLMTWEVIGQITEPRAQVSAILIDEENLLILGGRDGNNVRKLSSEIFNLRTGVSTKAADFPYVTTFSQLILADDGRPLAFAGRSDGPMSYRTQTIHAYDRLQNKWLAVGRTPDSLYLPTVRQLWDGRVLWTGGSIKETPGDVRLAKNVAQLDGTSFQNFGRLLTPRCGHGFEQLTDDLGIVVGGMTDVINALTTCEFVDLKSGVATVGPEMGTTHGFFRSVGIKTSRGQGVLAIGGYSISGMTNKVEILEQPCQGLEQSVVADLSPRLFGTASMRGDTIQLTDTATFSVGSAWVSGKVNVASQFTTSFSFRLTYGDDNDLFDGGAVGADGVALVISNVNSGGIGDAGRGIGYHDLPHGIAIEFDSYLNAAFGDPAGSHIAVQVGDGQKLSANHIAPYLKGISHMSVPSFVADGTTYHAKVEYDGSVLRVYCDTTGTFAETVLEVPIDISKELGMSADGRAWIGLTSATGFATERHEILSWTIGSCDPILVGVNEEGHDDVAAGASVKIVPQPSHDAARLELTGVEGAGIVTIHDLQGAELFRVALSAGQTVVSLPVDQLLSGTYVVRVATRASSDSMLWNVLR